jgi:hypothetical protein
MMFKATVTAMAALAIVAITLPVPPSAAQVCARFCPPPPTTSSSTPDGGTNNPGGGPDLPQPTPDEQRSSMEQVCNAALHSLAKVSVKLVEAYSNEPGASVVPLCNSGVGHSAKIDNSQALPLQNAIAGNPVLMDVLTAHGFHAEDVVGVTMGTDMAKLYVHR